MYVTAGFRFGNSIAYKAETNPNKLQVTACCKNNKSYCLHKKYKKNKQTKKQQQTNRKKAEQNFIVVVCVCYRVTSNYTCIHYTPRS